MFTTRSYAWFSIPLMLSGMIAILKPYIDQIIEISLLWLVIIAFITMLFFGWLERKVGFFQDEMRYGTALNPELSRRFDNIERLLEAKDE